jgi:hypothetical protein
MVCAIRPGCNYPRLIFVCPGLIQYQIPR